MNITNHATLVPKLYRAGVSEIISEEESDLKSTMEFGRSWLY